MKRILSVLKKGEFTLFVTVLAFVLISGQAHAQLAATLAIDSTARIANRVGVILTGTYTCGPVPAESTGLGMANLMGGVFEAFGRFVNSGFFFVDITPTCDGVQHPLQLDVISGVVWHPGSARVIVTMFAQDCSPFPSPCLTAMTSVDQTVRLQL